MKLELKHIAPYLPYELKIKYGASSTQFLGKDNLHLIDLCLNKQWKPILKPLSDLEYDNDVIFTLYANCHDIDENIDYFSEFIVDITHSSMSYRASQILLKNHYDVFALIDKGLAIDINTI